MSKSTILIKKPSNKIFRQRMNPIDKPSVNPLIQNGELKRILMSDLDPSPLNYHKFFPEAELEGLAADIALHGMISNLTVRPLPSGRYELLVGERRFRAAILIGLKEVLVNVVSLTDQEVIEIQLSENLQRANPHLMQEAKAMWQIQKMYKAIDELSARIGKSQAFIYGRLKLLALIQPLQDLFLADKCTAAQAFDIATPSPKSKP